MAQKVATEQKKKSRQKNWIFNFSPKLREQYTLKSTASLLPMKKSGSLSLSMPLILSILPITNDLTSWDFKGILDFLITVYLQTSVNDKGKLGLEK